MHGQDNSELRMETTCEAELRHLVMLSPDDLVGVWGEVEPLLDRACAYSGGAFSTESVRALVDTGVMRIIAYKTNERISSLVVVTITQASTGLRLFEILLASGEGMRDWLNFEDTIKNYAKQFGCHRMRAITREGMQRTLRHWRRTAVVLELDLDDKKDIN